MPRRGGCPAWPPSGTTGSKRSSASRSEPQPTPRPRGRTARQVRASSRRAARVEPRSEPGSAARPAVRSRPRRPPRRDRPRLAAPPPDREHRPSRAARRQAGSRTQSRRACAVVEDEDDPENQAGRGQPEMAEDQRRPDLPSFPLLHPATADPDCEQDEPSTRGDDPADECGPFHLVSLLLGPGEPRILGERCSRGGGKGTTGRSTK